MTIVRALLLALLVLGVFVIRGLEAMALALGRRPQFMAGRAAGARAIVNGFVNVTMSACNAVKRRIAIYLRHTHPGVHRRLAPWLVQRRRGS